MVCSFYQSGKGEGFGQKTKSVCGPGALCGLRMLCEGVSAFGDSGRAGMLRPGGYSKVCRLRKVRAGMPGQRGGTAGGAGMKKHWYDYLWVVSLIYLILGFFNILFA